MKTSDSGIELIKRFEGLELEAYQDIAGIWTIGYGHTGEDVQPGMKISERDAEELLKRDLKPREQAVSSAVKVPLNQNEFDALVSFVYNVGAGALRTSTALKRLNKGDRIGAADALTWWNKATVGGVLREVLGLTRRRASERALFLTPTEAAQVRDPERIEENSRTTPVEDTPRRDNVAQSRTVQGATIAGGAGVASSTIGINNTDELDQIETNIENGDGLTEKPAGTDDGTTDTDSTSDGAIGGDEQTDSTGQQAEGATGSQTDGVDTNGADNGQTVGPTDGQTEGQTEAPTDGDTEAPTDGGTEAPTDGDIESLTDGQTDGQTESSTDGSTDGQTEMPGDSHTDQTGEMIEVPADRPSKHEVHAVESQIQFALLILIVLSVLFVIWARFDDWNSYRR